MATHARNRRVLHWIAFVVLLVAAIGTQMAIDGAFERFTPIHEVHLGPVAGAHAPARARLQQCCCGHLLDSRRSVLRKHEALKAENKDYELLFPLLDITTTLDPRFNIAYRFGAILLSEGYPNGPGSPDEAIALLEKGIRESPDKWEYYHDAGFVEYWWRRDTRAAADWFMHAIADCPTAPNWLQPLAASILAEGGDQLAARALWTQLAQTAEQEWMRQTARTRLQQLDAEAVSSSSSRSSTASTTKRDDSRQAGTR